MTAKQQVIDLCKEDLLYFGKLLTPKAFYLPTPDFHREISDLFMDRSKKQVMVMAPRGFAKSTLSKRLVLHHILFDPGDKVIILQSKTRPEAINRLSSLKNIFEYSNLFKDMFGYCGVDSPNTKMWREDKIKTALWLNGERVNISIKAIGTGMPARGTLETSDDESLEEWRITLFYVDDPDDEDNTLTVDQMEKNWDKFAGTKEGLDKRTGRVFVLGTFIRDGCIVDRLDEAEGWCTKKYEARWDDEDGHHLLWEEMRDDQWLDDKLAEFNYQGTPWKYWSEFHNKNTHDKDRLFIKWHTWDGEMFFEGDYPFLKITEIDGIELATPKIEPVNNFVGIDPASSEKQSADSSVTMPISYSTDRRIYTQKYYNRRVKPTAHAEQIIESIRQYKFYAGAVESTSYQEMLRQYLIQRMREENLWLSGLETKWLPRTEKSARLEALEPFFSNDKMYIKKGSPELEDQIRQYPRNKKSPNLLDGLYYATRKLVLPDHTVESSSDDSKYFPFQYLNKKRNNWITA